MRAAARPGAALVSATVVTVLLLGGCGGGSDATGGAAPSPPGGSMPPPTSAPSPGAAPPPAPAPGPAPAPPGGPGPVAGDACLAFPQANGDAVDGSLAARVDAGGESVVFTLASQPTGGTVTLGASGDFTYARSSAARGDMDRFAYRVTDAAGQWAEAEVRIVYGTRRIMPLGDSITDGVERYHPSTGSLPEAASRTGYRKGLRERLLAQGYAVDFVGSQRSGAAAGLADAEHEGHPGYRQANIRDEIGGWLDGSPADVVLLHIGTNDINAASSTDVTATGEALSRMQAWSGDTGNPPLTVMLATVIGQRFGGAGLVPLFNANLVALHAAQWSTPAARFAVSLVDVNEAVDVAQHLSGPSDDVTGLHPNAEGYGRIADAWFDALVRSEAVRRCP